MKRFVSYLLLVLGITAGCGDTNGGAWDRRQRRNPTGRAERLPLELHDRYPRPRDPHRAHLPAGPAVVAGATADLTFSAAVIFDEAFSAALIDAGVSKVDIMSMDITSSVLGATPSMLETSLADGNQRLRPRQSTPTTTGRQAPIAWSWTTVTTTASVDEDATEVELGLGLDGLSLHDGRLRGADRVPRPDPGRILGSISGGKPRLRGTEAPSSDGVGPR